MLQDKAASNPNKVAIEFLTNKKITSYTFLNLHQKALAIAEEIKKNCQQGDRVILLYPPSIDFIAAFWGCIYAGVVPVPTPLPLKKSGFSQRLEIIIANCSPALMLTTTTIKKALQLNQIANFLEQVPLVKQVTSKFLERFPIDHKVQLAHKSLLTTDQIKPITKGFIADSGPNDILLLQYTSGSTDDPRGVMLTHENLLENMAVISGAFELNQDSRLFLWLPPYHDLGLMGSCFHPVYEGYTVRLMSPLQFIKDPLLWIEQISAFKADTSGGPNFAYDLCVRYYDAERAAKLDLSSWRRAFNGAETINYQTLKNFQQTFMPHGLKKNVFFPCYGLAESVVFVTGVKNYGPDQALILDREELGQDRIVLANKDEANTIRIVTCGENLPRQDLKIVSDAGDILPDLTLGNIVVKNQSTGLGYWNNTAATQDIFKYKVKGMEGNFLKTGDLGFLYQNNLYITGRKKEVLNIHGVSSYPHWIEAEIERQFSMVRKHCCAAMQIPELSTDKIVMALEIDEANVDQEFLKSLGVQIFKLVYENFRIQIDRILFLPKRSLVKTTSGKIPRSIIAKQILNNELNPLYIWYNFSGLQNISVVTFDAANFSRLNATDKQVYLQEFVIKIMNNLLHNTENSIKSTDSIENCLNDSLMQLEFFSQLESSLGITVPPYLIENKTVAEFSQILFEKLLAKNN